MRRPVGRRGLKGKGGGKIVDTVHISERPAEAEDRAVPGHWEGDLLFGKAMSPIGTLVERSTRFVLLFKLAHHDSETVVKALAKHIQTLPEPLRRSLTWDQGVEMARHAQITVDTGVQVYFCDPKSPWQRGSTRTPTGCCASTSRARSSTSTHSPKTSSTLSPPSSTGGLARPWDS